MPENKPWEDGCRSSEEDKDNTTDIRRYHTYG